MRITNPFLKLAQISAVLSSIAAATWILVNPADPPDDPRAWVSIFTFLWQYLLSVGTFLVAVGGAVAHRAKYPGHKTIILAVLALLLPFVGQRVAYALWGPEPGPLG